MDTPNSYRVLQAAPGPITLALVAGTLEAITEHPGMADKPGTKRAMTDVSAWLAQVAEWKMVGEPDAPSPLRPRGVA